MKKLRPKSLALLTAALATALLIGAGCTKYASQDDLRNLEEAKQAAISAEKELGDARAERRQLEKEVAAKEAELTAAQAELDKVKSR